MNFDELIESANESNLSIALDNEQRLAAHKLSNEALFHLPLLAMTVLLLSGDRSKPKSEEIGQLVGECFEKTFLGFKSSTQLIGWSANLRMRTVRALTFLELAKLVEIEKSHQKLTITDNGKKILQKAMSGDTDLAYSLGVLRRSYRNVRVEKQISMELS